MDYKTLIHTVIDPFVNNPESILIRETVSEDEKEKTYLVISHEDDTKKLIGKQGCIANSIRDIVNVAAKLEGIRVKIKFESFESSEEKK